MAVEDMKDTQATKPLVPAVERAVRLLDMVAQSDEPLTLSSICRNLGLPKSSIHGLCNTLVDLGLLGRSGNAFVMGGHVMLWANAFVAKSDMVSEFVRLWDGNTQLKSETATLTILDGADVVYIASQHGVDPLGITFRNGMRLPAAFTATGKAILSTMPQSAVTQLYSDGLPAPLTPHTVTDMDALFRELELIREKGYSIDDQQIREGMFCFGAPVYDFTSNRAVGGIALSVHANWLDEARSEEIGKAAIQYARLLSQRLGSQPSKA